MKDGVLLDTHAALWLINRDRMTTEALKRIRRAAADAVLFVSAISAWEIAALAEKGRIDLQMPVHRWWDEFVNQPGLQLADLDPATLIESTQLPEPIHRDPADRMLIATARLHRLTLITRDRRILDYAQAGHLRALTC